MISTYRVSFSQSFNSKIVGTANYGLMMERINPKQKIQMVLERFIDLQNMTTILIDARRTIYKALSYGEDGDELGRLLGIVSDKGLKALDLIELDKLRILLLGKDYGDNKKSNKSKAKLLKQINNAFYDRHRPRRFF